MFVALEVARPKHNGLRGMLERMRTQSPVLEERRVMNAPFVLLHIMEGARGSSWEEIEEITGRYASRMLLPDGVDAPPDSRVRNLACSEYDRQIFVRTACEIIQRTRMQLYKRVLGLLDADGQYMDWLPELLKYYTAVHVVTREEERYLKKSEHIMQEMGAPVLVGDSLAHFRECVLVLAPAGVQQAGPAPACPVLTGEKIALPPQWLAAGRLRPQQARHLLELCPKGIEPHRFAAALYEHGGLKSLPVVAQHLLVDGKETQLSELVHRVCAVKGV